MIWSVLGGRLRSTHTFLAFLFQVHLGPGPHRAWVAKESIEFHENKFLTEKQQALSEGIDETDINPNTNHIIHSKSQSEVFGLLVEEECKQIFRF